MTSPSVPKLDRSALLGILAQQSDDVLADLMSRIAQAAIDAQFDEFIGAEQYERSAERKDRRNGSRDRTVDTRMGSIDLRIPRSREGNFVPPLVEHRKRSERALVVAVQEMFISGVSTRKIDKVLNELGVAHMSKSQVSVLCAELDGQVTAFRERRLESAYPYLMLDALYVSVREDGRVAKQAVVIAYGVNERGIREVIGIDVVQTESKDSWLGFLRSLVARGLHVTLLVVSDAHEGLRAAITAVFGATALWQRCRVHFLRNVLAHVSHHRKLELAEAFRSILAQATANEARERGRGHRALREIMSQSDGDSRRRPRRRIVVLRLPDGASAQALVFESDRASQRHATQTNQRRGHLSEPCIGGSPHLDGAHRADRRLDHRTPVHE